MRALIIGPDEKAAIQQVVNYAMEANHYYVVGAPMIPGKIAEFVALIPDGYRCVFTITKHEGKLFRHLTVSVSANGKLPSFEATETLAREFGFTASTDQLNLYSRIKNDGWIASPGHEGENCIVVAQEIK